MYTLKIFGDNHDEPTATIAVKNALPSLKEHGYDVLFLESPYKEANIDQSIDYLEESIGIVTLFPTGSIPEIKTREQENFLAKYLPHYDHDYERYKTIVEKIFAAQKSHFESHKERIEMLKLLKKLGMRLVNIDVRHPTDYYNAGGVGKRNEYMFNEIKSGFMNSSKGIVFVGMAHVVDSWEYGAFNIGIKSLILKHSHLFDVERCKTYYLYTKENEILQDVRTKVDRCNMDIVGRIELLKAENLNDFQTTLERELLKELKEPLISKIGSENRSNYFIPAAPNSAADLQTFHYMNSLGGKFVKKVSNKDINHPFLSGFLFDLPVSVLDKRAKREILNVDRCFIPIEEKNLLDYLRTNITTLSVDEITRSTGARGFYLTFFDDSGFKGKSFEYITNREHIKMAKKAIQYQPVIEHLDSTLDKDIKWRFIYGDNDELLVTLKEGYFDNEEGAAFFVEKFKQKGLDNISLKEDNGKWYIVIGNLHKILGNLNTNTKISSYRQTL